MKRENNRACCQEHYFERFEQIAIGSDNISYYDTGNQELAG